MVPFEYVIGRRVLTVVILGSILRIPEYCFATWHEESKSRDEHDMKK
jgi:hypothetical protein